jgi:predicted phosphodiesterase
MIAVISDVHANIEALEAVMQDIKRRNIERVFFLGDIVGYGPNPLEVLNYLKDFEYCLIGNHDAAVLYKVPENFNHIAKRAAEWTRRQIDPSMHKNPLAYKTARLKRESWDFLQSLKTVFTVHDLMFCHDTPASPGSSLYVRNGQDAETIFRTLPHFRAFFIGHSHIPRIHTRSESITPEPGRHYKFSDRMIFNVGSVGQPRDGDPRSCYVIIDDGVRYIRVPYDNEKTAKKIIEVPELDSFLAKRILLGK